MSASALTVVKLTSIQFPQHRTAPQANARKRKRQQESEDELHSTPAGKRLQAPARPGERISGVEAANSVSENGIHPVDNWRKERHWPKHYVERKSSMDHLLARKKSSSSLRRNGQTLALQHQVLRRLATRSRGRRRVHHTGTRVTQPG